MTGPKNRQNPPTAPALSPTPVGQADLYQGAFTPAAEIAQWPGVFDRALDEAESRRMFQRTLSCWAVDVLRLKRRGLDVPVNRRSMSFPPAPVSAPLRRAA
ncbi:MAG: hypothetical protein ACKVZJ_15065 [Phycisphaerales bacterium]